MSHEQKSGVWRPVSGASEESIGRLVKDCPIPLPGSYLRQLRMSDGGEGELGVEPGWIVFWPADEVMVANQGHRVAEFVPGFYGFGSNGGGELLAFDCRGTIPFPIVMIPFIPMESGEAQQIAISFDELRGKIGIPLETS